MRENPLLQIYAHVYLHLKSFLLKYSKINQFIEYNSLYLRYTSG